MFPIFLPLPIFGGQPPKLWELMLGIAILSTLFIIMIGIVLPQFGLLNPFTVSADQFCIDADPDLMDRCVGLIQSVNRGVWGLLVLTIGSWPMVVLAYSLEKGKKEE